MATMANNFSSSMSDVFSDTPLDPRRTFQIVVATTKEMGIGEDEKLPWKLPSDMKFFKEITYFTSAPLKRNAVIIGRKTWESITVQFRPLIGCLNVVLSRSGSFDIATAKNVVMCGSLGSALEMLATPPHSMSIEIVFVIGGGQIYREALCSPNCDAIHIIEIENAFECDTFITPVNESVFRPWYSSFPFVENDIRYFFTTYVRIRNSPNLDSLEPSHRIGNGVNMDVYDRFESR